MPKCPECGEEIDYLINICKEENRYIFQLGRDGSPEYEWNDAWKSDDFNVYECPICGAELFDDEKDATNFLKPKTKQITFPVGEQV